MRGTSGGMCLSKSSKAVTVSPMQRLKAWELVPAAATPASFAPRMEEQETQPPTIAA